ncbi:sugar phosphate isomerase/epimerase [Actinopolymorpha sp. B17G11]|uniref:sugar phosphate isomerase/epimerase family protein n=1 Tax=unclassified Actinopolymorpha TaxID=2627063 RepID=UPI0032D9AC3B
MKLGCNTVLFASVDVESAVEAIAFAGYSYVEFAAIKGMCEHISPDNDTGAIKRLTTLLGDNGLTATAIEAATTDRDRLERIFDLATRLEIPIVNVGSGGKTGDEESTKQAIAHLATLAELAGEYSLTLAVKPHVGQAIYNGASALRLTSEVTHPALGLNFDPSHLFRADENPDDIAKSWGERIVTSHFRDCASREQKVGPPPTQIPGRGTVDIPATLRALAEVGYDGPLNLEVIGAGSYSPAQASSIAAESRGYLHRCLQEINAG